MLYLCRFVTVSQKFLMLLIFYDFTSGIKDYSEWPTIPQVFFKGEFIGGCDILLQMHQSGELIEELEKIGIKSALLSADDTKK